MFPPKLSSLSHTHTSISALSSPRNLDNSVPKMATANCTPGETTHVLAVQYTRRVVAHHKSPTHGLKPPSPVPAARHIKGGPYLERVRAGVLAVLEQRHAQVLLDGADELGRRVEHGAGVVEEDLHQLQRQRLAACLSRPRVSAYAVSPASHPPDEHRLDPCPPRPRAYPRPVWDERKRGRERPRW
jgi:hypothetical protein